MITGEQVVTMIGSIIGIIVVMTGILYLALTSRLDDRYIKDKDCKLARSNCRETSDEKEKVRDVMIKSIRDDVSELKETNKTIFEKLDKLSDHIIDLKGT